MSPKVKSPEHGSLVESPGDRKTGSTQSDKENKRAFNYKSKSSGAKGLAGAKVRALDIYEHEYLSLPLKVCEAKQKVQYEDCDDIIEEESMARPA